jgi:hypothetical protein
LSFLFLVATASSGAIITDLSGQALKSGAIGAVGTFDPHGPEVRQLRLH